MWLTYSQRFNQTKKIQIVMNDALEIRGSGSEAMIAFDSEVHR